MRSLNVNNIYMQKIDEIQSRIPVKIFKKDFSLSFSQILNEKINNKSSFNNSNKTDAKNAYSDIVYNASKKYGIGEDIISAVISLESGFNKDALSKAGAMGLMQLMPQTAKSLGVDNPFDPEKNIDGGVRYLKQMLDTFGNDIKMALAAYNCGPSALKKLNITDLNDITQFSKLPKETKDYINKILKLID